MKLRITLFTLALFALAVPALAASQAPAAAPGIWFFIQQDAHQAMEQLQFDKGFQQLLAGLPPDMPIRIYYFVSTRYDLLWEGNAGQASWPIPGSEFSVRTPSTTPYKDLLRLLEAEKVENRKIVFITNGISEDMLMQEDTEGLIGGAFTFTPSRYPTLDEVVNYCRAHHVPLYGFFVGWTPPARGDLRDISFSMFRYVVEESKGKSFYNYNSFPGVFETVLREGLLTR